MYSNSLSGWPDYTCVLAYIDHAISKIATSTPASSLAKYLNIKVPLASENPYGFDTTDLDECYGINVIDIKKDISVILEKFAPKYVFHLTTLEMIVPGMYEEFMQDAIKLKILLAVGYDFSVINGNSKDSLHVSFVSKVWNGRVSLIDYYIDKKGKEINIEYPTIIEGIRRVKGGFWLIGTQNDLNLLSKLYEL